MSRRPGLLVKGGDQYDYHYQDDEGDEDDVEDDDGREGTNDDIIRVVRASPVYETPNALLIQTALAHR